MAYPNIKNFNFPDCCHKRIKRINQKVKLGNALQSVVAVGTLFNIFGPSPSGINTIVAIHQTDFTTFSQAVAAIPDITRTYARRECEQEYINHIGNGNIEKFWKGMVDVFS